MKWCIIKSGKNQVKMLLVQLYGSNARICQVPFIARADEPLAVASLALAAPDSIR